LHNQRYISLLKIHQTSEVSEQVNRMCPPGNTILQLSTPYNDPSHPTLPYHASTEKLILVRVFTK